MPQTISSGRTVNVSAGHVVSGAVVLGGTLNVLSGGNASNTVVSSGWLNVSAGGLAVSSTVTQGGSATLMGGTAKHTIVSGGYQGIFENGVPSGTTIVGTDQAYGEQDVDAKAVDTIVSSGGTQALALGAIASNTMVFDAGVMQVGSGSTARGVTVHAGGVMVEFDHTTVSNVHILSGGGIRLLGGPLNAKVDSGGFVIVNEGYRYNGLHISNGVDLQNDGHTSGTVVGKGGIEEIGGDAVESGARIMSGGTLVFEGGKVTFTAARGATLDLNYGRVNNQKVGPAITFKVDSGTTASAVEIDGGTAIVSGGGRLIGTTDFATDRGQLTLRAAKTAITVSGFNATDRLHLTAFAFNKRETVSYAQNAAKTGGVLTVAEGKFQVQVTLFGHYVAAGFHLIDYPAGGTTVTYTSPAPAHIDLTAGHFR